MVYIKTNKFKIISIPLIILLLIFSIMLFIYLYNIKKINDIGYSFNTSREIYRKDYKDYILKNKYNKIIDKYILDENFNDKYIKEYYGINIKNIDNFIVIINNLLNSGYRSYDINQIMNKYDKYFVEYLINNEVKDISKYTQYDYFLGKNIDRYIKHFNGDYSDTIIEVNIGLDYPFYENANTITTFSNDIIINKYNKVDKDFKVDNLTKVEKCVNGEFYLAKDAKEFFEKMCDASAKEGLGILIEESYRSFEEQEKIYNYYLNTNGEVYAKNYVALPGYSEHHTGLALDVKSSNTNIFAYSKEYTWLKNNAYKYGYIIRYEEGKESITGYKPEEWHIRYVGENIAKYIYENNLTYEEYYAMYKIN